MTWRPMASSMGVVRGRQWSTSAGRAVTTHRRGWRGVITLDGSLPAKILVCGHAHAKRARADECARLWARDLNEDVTDVT